MSKKIEINHAEIKPIYGTQDQAFREFKGEKGITFTFSVQTRINDKVSNSPFIFDSCSFWTDSEEKANQFKNQIKVGNVISIIGFADRNKNKDKYYDFINVKSIIPITNTNDNNDDDENLPF